MRTVATLVSTLLLACLVGAASVAPAGAATDLLLILDASGSMWGQVAGEAKIVIARRVMKDLAGKIPAGTEVGLIAYGHRREGDCDDIETIIALGPLDAAAIGAKVEALNAKGKTPITKAVQQAIAALKARDTAATVVLVSDGIETCGGDPCAAVRDAKQAGVKFVMHVVGFDVGDVDVSQLECAAQAGGGLYFDTKNADDLAGALDQALEAPTAEAKPTTLAVQATEAGTPIDALVEIMAAGATERIASGRTYTAPETNPRRFPLAPGRYDVAVTHLGMEGDARQRREGVEVKEGEVTEVVVDFGPGTLAIKATRNGALEDCMVAVYPAGTKNRVAGGRTYTSESSNPQVFEINPGTYDVGVASVRLGGGAEQRFEGLEVRRGETTTREVDFSAGELSVKITRNGALSDATVTVARAGAREHVASGRTYTAASSNPKVFELMAGTYDVRVGVLEIQGGVGTEFTGATVVPGERVDLARDFPSGTLEVSATSGGEGVDAMVAVRLPAGNESVATGRTYGRPKTFELTPGAYEVELKPIKLEGASAKKVVVTIEAGQKRAETLTFP
jgi:Ca-activated chloride channel family protein